MQSCPVQYPSPLQFNDFNAYVHSLQRKYKADYGMVKIVPPVDWKPQTHNYAVKLAQLTLKHPIEQNVQGTGGFYETKNIVQNRISLKAYRKYAEQQGKKVEGKTEVQKEDIFWKTITYSPPIYGADLTATLMDQQAGEWNFNSLNSILRHALTEKVKGVTEPYCYIGCWKAFFSWHKQDLDLSAINYIHQGASKIWYSISKDHTHLLEEQARSHFKLQSRSCPEFLRHKTFLINPHVLLNNHPDLKITRVEHKAGEIMIVFGGAYHCGFNCGFNVAEAVNYATIDWLRELTTVQFCSCFKKSVKGEIQSILYNLQNSSKYEQLQQRQPFQILQSYVYYLQLSEINNQPICPYNIIPSNDQIQNLKNVNGAVQNEKKERKKEVKEVKEGRLMKGSDSKKIKKDIKSKLKNKKKRKNQQLYLPSTKLKLPKPQTLLQTHSNQTPAIQQPKKQNPLLHQSQNAFPQDCIEMYLS